MGNLIDRELIVVIHLGGMRTLTLKFLLSVFLIGLMLTSKTVSAEMNSSNYRIQWDNVGVGGVDSASSASYQLRDESGGTSGVSTSTSYRLDTGYRAGIYDPVSSFSLLNQDYSTQVAATSLVGTAVTVTSASGFASGDYLLIVQDEGASQLSAFGKVTGVAGNVVTLDFLGGDTVVVDGSGDYAYELSTGSLALGTLSSSSVTTRSTAWDATADVDSAYTIYVFEDGDLISGSDTIADVADGSVTAGSSEYGGRSSDTTLTGSTFDTQDTAFTTSLQEVASRSNNTFKGRDILTLKTAISASQAAGTYGQTLTVLFVGNY